MLGWAAPPASPPSPSPAPAEKEFMMATSRSNAPGLIRPSATALMATAPPVCVSMPRRTLP